MIDPNDRPSAAIRLLFGGFLAIFWSWLGFAVLMLQGFYLEHVSGAPQPAWAFIVLGVFVAIGGVGVVAGTLAGWRCYRLLRDGLPASARPVEESRRVFGNEVKVWCFRFRTLDGREQALYPRSLYRGRRGQEAEFERKHREGEPALVLYRRDEPEHAVLASELPRGFELIGRNLIDVRPTLPTSLYLVPPLLAVGVNGWVFVRLLNVV